MLISGVIACVIAGITEPLEFLFLFTAPYLYLVHNLHGLGFLAVSLLHVTIGNTDGNLIDLVVFRDFCRNKKTKWYLIPPLGLVWFALYYFTFKFAILKFNLHTLGGKIVKVARLQAQTPIILTKNERAQTIVAALGGRENILYH